MRVLKYFESSAKSIATFVNDNNIPQEDILTITRSDSVSDAVSLVLFYYADADTKEKTRNFWGNLKEN